jgi:hypothetical protein
MNIINIIFPYKKNGQWMFDDEAVGLREEPFVSGADSIIDLLTSSIDNAGQGFALTFSEYPFPGQEHCLDWVRSEYGGNVYRLEHFNAEGWLCPALLLYFKNPPYWIYIKASAKKEEK